MKSLWIAALVCGVCGVFGGMTMGCAGETAESDPEPEPAAAPAVVAPSLQPLAAPASTNAATNPYFKPLGNAGSAGSASGN